MKCKNPIEYKKNSRVQKNNYCKNSVKKESFWDQTCWSGQLEEINAGYTFCWIGRCKNKKRENKMDQVRKQRMK